MKAWTLIYLCAPEKYAFYGARVYTSKYRQSDCIRRIVLVKYFKCLPRQLIIIIPFDHSSV